MQVPTPGEGEAEGKRKGNCVAARRPPIPIGSSECTEIRLDPSRDSVNIFFMKRRLYIETTVVSYFVARPSRDLLMAGHQEATRELWPSLSTVYDTYVSALVFEEAARGDSVLAASRLAAIKPFRMLDIDDEARALAAKILSGKGIPQEYPEDALHIAVSAVNGIDVVVTWNFAHLSNPFTRMLVRQIIQNEGYVCPEICSPEELPENES